MMGPLVTRAQRERVLGFIRTGRGRGRHGRRSAVASPRTSSKGFFVEPTVLVDVDPDATIAQEEIFGPVLVVIPYDDDDDAVRIANNSIYGLSGGVVSGATSSGPGPSPAASAPARCRSTAASTTAPTCPSAATSQCGIGREMGVAGFEEYLEIKSIAEPA